ncbi:MAG: gliding motility-associated ABC transporter permease subunit GldF, partial [Bacteroidales bacterium]|jgi:ABC-2 type transport system permease protein|nr:gliding motility-associated ABC transporter permease subunit GldF [Bacteroidales bacterium]
LAKYFANVILLIVSILPTFIYLLSIYFLGVPKGNIDFGAIWGSYLGLFFLGATFVSIGIFCSLLTDNQIVSFILSVLISFILWLGFDFIYSFDVFGSFGQIMKWFGIDHHYASISRGVIDTRDLLYFVSVITLFLLFSRLRLQSRKW